MKIWLINNYCTLPEHGQLNRNYHFGRHLKQLGHEPVAFVGSHPHNTKLQLINDGNPYRTFQEKPFPWVLIKTFNYEGSKKKQILSMFEFYKNMIIAAKHFEKPDVIIGSSAHPFAALLAIHLGQKYNCKKIVEIRDLWPESLVDFGIVNAYNPIVFLMRIFEKWLYKHADSVIFTFAGGYDYIKEQGWEKDIPKSKTHYVNNGIELSEFDCSKEQFVIDDEDLRSENQFRVIYAGSIRKANNLGKLIDVAKLVENKKVKFLIWGDGDELPKLKERVGKENISNVVFKGRIAKKFIPFITSKADVNFMHLSSVPLLRFGISANKIFDYLAAGKPILCDFNANYNPIITYGAGIAVDSGRVEDIARVIDEMAGLSKEKLELYGRNARWGAKEFDFANLTNKLVDAINSIE